jgi:hypothetical protein
MARPLGFGEARKVLALDAKVHLTILLIAARWAGLSLRVEDLHCAVSRRALADATTCLSMNWRLSARLTIQPLRVKRAG